MVIFWSVHVAGLSMYTKDPFEISEWEKLMDVVAYGMNVVQGIKIFSQKFGK